MSETALEVIEEVNDTESESNFSLKIGAGVAEKSNQKLDSLSVIDREEVDELIEKAVQSAKSTNEDGELIAQVVSVS